MPALRAQTYLPRIICTAANYGRDEWWLLLDPVQEAEEGGSS